MSPQRPMDRLRQANPVSLQPAVTSARRKNWRRPGQVLLAVLGALVIGTGVAWAANGGNPVASLFGDDVKIVKSDAALDSLSVLEPATRQAFDALPPDLAFRASAVANRHSMMENLRNGDPPFTEHGRSRSEGFDPVPVELSAFGQGRTSSGSLITIMVIAGEVCGYLDIRGPGICGSMEQLRQGGLTGGAPERADADLWRIFGVMPDDVAAIKIEGSKAPPVPVSDNVFELRNAKRVFLPLIGLDVDGNRLFGPSG